MKHVNEKYHKPGVGGLVETGVLGMLVVGAVGTEFDGKLGHTKLVNSISSIAISPE